jgi:EAL domain-containing protein (putative c-di-GMP-specific phosphodiesterase class I)
MQVKGKTLTLDPAGKVPKSQVKLLAEVQETLAKEDILLVKLLVTNKSILEVQYGEPLVLQAVQELETSLSTLNSVAKIERVSPVLIAMQAKDPSNSLGFMQGVRSALRGINTSGSYRFLLNASIGAVVTDHTSSLDAEAWFGRLNLALMKSTRTGRPELADEKLALSERARQELSRLGPGSAPPEGMYWVFQPINYVATGEIYGYEALCRWEIPDVGPVSPDVFIQVAEDLNLIQIIDFWTLKAVEKAYPELAANGGEVISINLSAQTVGNDHKFFFAAIDLLLPKLKEVNFSLIFELTETSVFDNQIDLTMGLFGLQQRGAMLAIDDFGTGKTSLSIIGSLPTDFVKLDGSLIAVEKPELRRGLLELGVKFAELVGAEVIVEKVETEAELEFAREVGAKFAQGWRYGKPLDLRPSADKAS